MAIENEDAGTAECARCGACVEDVEDVTRSNGRSWSPQLWSVELWCDRCAETHSFYCDRSHRRYAEDDFRAFEVEGRTICLDAYEDELYAWESDGEYHWEPEPDDYIPDYHSRPRDFRCPDGDAYTLGVELEVYCPDAQDCYAQRPDGIIGERDGSLDGYHGVEFIGPPRTFDEYVSDAVGWRGFLKSLRMRDAEGRDGYGMHVSVGRQNVDEAHQARFILLLNACQEMSEEIAGREQNQWANYRHKDARDAWDAARNGSSHYSATAVDAQRVEVRIFQSTTDDSRFMANIEYVQAAMEYTRDAAVSKCLSADGFRVWLAKHSGRFPNLCARLTSCGMPPMKCKRAIRDELGRFSSKRRLKARLRKLVKEHSAALSRAEAELRVAQARRAEAGNAYYYALGNFESASDSARQYREADARVHTLMARIDRLNADLRDWERRLAILSDTSPLPEMEPKKPAKPRARLALVPRPDVWDLAAA